MYSRVVVPLDGSEFAEEALPHATQLAGFINAPLHLVRVADFARLQQYGPFGVAVESVSFDELFVEEQESARQYLETMVAKLATPDLAVTSEQRHGSVVSELLAATRPEDVIVMASHGRGGVTRWFLGSVAEDFVRRATVPVLLVPARAAMAAREEQR